MSQEHGTAAAELVRRYNEGVLVPVVRAVPKATEGIDAARLQAALKKKGAALTVGLYNLFVELSRRLPYPPIGEVFELTLDGCDPSSDPIEMVRGDGYNEPERWEFKGERVIDLETRRFKLVEIGYQPNFNAVREAFREHGTIPGGQWREAFKANFEPDSKGPIGIADASWLNPLGSASFPYVDANGSSYFLWADSSFRVGWRWLVEVSK